MSAMIPFSAPIDDILFSLRHVAAVPGWDAEMVTSILSHFAAFAEGELAPLNMLGDAQGARLVAGRVQMPDGFRDAYARLAADGWQGLSAPEGHGGLEQDGLVAAGVSEIFSGANHALQMICNLVPGAIDVLLHHGTAAQQAYWIPRLASGATLATMCLTEPGAGSDLSRIACRAFPDAQGWRIEGDKIFVSGGDQDLSDSILHLVLARTGPEGLKGLSLFLCPASPEVQVTRLEGKLGLHASPTCQMRFDGARAELVGQAGSGLRAMFKMMNHARIDVALQGVAHAARAARIARAYTSDRVQGRKADGTHATLADHADVARMLDLQDSLALGGRAMCHITLGLIETRTQPELVDFLTPLCKVFCSEAGIHAADLGIQILGGYGYLTEYQLSQTWRDARITAIYEGANGIHERSIATRGLRGVASALFADLVRDLAHDRPEILAALKHWQVASSHVRASEQPDRHAHSFAQQTARLFYAAAWSRIVQHADMHPDPERLRRLAAGVLPGMRNHC